MENEILKLFRREHCDREDYPYLERAFNAIDAKDLQPRLIKREQNFDSNDVTCRDDKDPDAYRHSSDDVPIKTLITFLQKKLSEGFTTVGERWSGYEDNYFVLCKDEMETVEDIVERLHSPISHNIATLMEEEYKKAQNRKRIAELQKEIAKLKKDI